MSAELLQTEGLVQRYPGAGAAAVRGVSLAVGAGEIVALLGPSGCGKTTTLRLIGGFETPAEGRIALGGRDITALSPEDRGIGFVFQDYALFPHMTVAANVAFGLPRRRGAGARARVEEMLELVGLSGLARRMPHELSGGQQQRVALARSLAPAPDLVLMDEPFSNLDAAMRIETRQEVRALLKASGAAAILVTHDQEEALALADRVAVMEAGRILQIDTPDAIYRRPASEFVARFLGRSNILEGTARGRWADTALGPVALDREAEGRVRLAVRPEQIRFDEAGTGAEGAVIGREFRGHDQVYWVRAGESAVMALTHDGIHLADGARVRLSTAGPAALIGAGAAR